MPLFGKSKKDTKDSEKSVYPVTSYPTAPHLSHTQYSAVSQQMGAAGGQAYPTQGFHQAHPMVHPGQPQTQYGLQGVHSPCPPPAYTPTYQPPPPPGSQTVIVQGGFDAGARFSHGTVSLPPPPPGVMPSTAQVAAAQGQNVVVTQKKGSLMMGGSDGGYCIW